eukprot:scaffold5407_cov96-Isochrysis_galbana.AAC.2
MYGWVARRAPAAPHRPARPSQREKRPTASAESGTGRVLSSRRTRASPPRSDPRRPPAPS